MIDGRLVKIQLRRRGAGAVSIYRPGYNANRRDIVIMAITSRIRMPLAFGEAIIGDWQGAGLVKASVLKPVLTTIEQGLVVRTIGLLSVADVKALREVVGDMIG